MKVMFFSIELDQPGFHIRKPVLDQLNLARIGGDQLHMLRKPPLRIFQCSRCNSRCCIPVGHFRLKVLHRQAP